MTTVESLQHFISKDLLNVAELVQPDEALLDGGLVDSLGVIRLVEFIESSFQCSIPPEDFTIENFGTIDAIASYVGNKLSESR